MNPERTPHDLLLEIRASLSEARASIVRNVNTTLVSTYWQIGKYIVEYEQHGAARAEYAKGLIDFLAKHLTEEFGGGFTATNLKYMRLFYKRFPIRHSLRDELTWTHYRTLLKVQNDDALAYYINECVAEKSDMLVRFTLPEGENQIFAAKYMTVMPTSDELKQLLL